MLVRHAFLLFIHSFLMYCRVFFPSSAYYSYYSVHLDIEKTDFMNWEVRLATQNERVL